MPIFFNVAVCALIMRTFIKEIVLPVKNDELLFLFLLDETHFRQIIFPFSRQVVFPTNYFSEKLFLRKIIFPKTFFYLTNYFTRRIINDSFPQFQSKIQFSIVWKITNLSRQNNSQVKTSPRKIFS